MIFPFLVRKQKKSVAYVDLCFCSFFFFFLNRFLGYHLSKLSSWGRVWRRLAFVHFFPTEQMWSICFSPQRKMLRSHLRYMWLVLVNSLRPILKYPPCNFHLQVWQSTKYSLCQNRWSWHPLSGLLRIWTLTTMTMKMSLSRLSLVSRSTSGLSLKIVCYLNIDMPWLDFFHYCLLQTPLCIVMTLSVMQLNSKCNDWVNNMSISVFVLSLSASSEHLKILLQFWILGGATKGAYCQGSKWPLPQGFDLLWNHQVASALRVLQRLWVRLDGCHCNLPYWFWSCLKHTFIFRYIFFVQMLR